jgi:hypothetical protein
MQRYEEASEISSLVEYFSASAEYLNTAQQGKGTKKRAKMQNFL